MTDESEREHAAATAQTNAERSRQRLGSPVDLPSWIESDADRAAFLDSLAGMTAPRLPEWLEDPASRGPRISLVKDKIVPAPVRKSVMRLAKVSDTVLASTEPEATVPTPEAIPVTRSATWSTVAPRQPDSKPEDELSRLEQLRRRHAGRAQTSETVLARVAAAVVILLALLLPALVVIGPREYVPAEDVVRAFSTIDRLQPGAQALVVVENAAGHDSALASAERVVLGHLVARQAHVIAASAGGTLDLNQLGVAQPDAITPFTTPDDVDTIRRLGGRNGTGKQAMPTDANLRKATGGKPLDLVVVFAGDAIDASRWLGNFRQGGVPAGIAVVAGGDTKLLASIRGSGQAAGIVSAPGDLAAYLSLAGSGPYPTKAGGASSATGPALAAFIIVVGLAAMFRNLIVMRIGGQR